MDYYPQGLPRNEEGIDVDSVTKDGETTDLSSNRVRSELHLYISRNRPRRIWILRRPVRAVVEP